MRMRLQYGHPIHLLSVDKFPPMVNYIIPSGVRIADGAKVRLGAYLAPGTTVMHAGFVNFNAGTLGACLIAVSYTHLLPKELLPRESRVVSKTGIVAI